jgi:hypothetical protein
MYPHPAQQLKKVKKKIPVLPKNKKAFVFVPKPGYQEYKKIRCALKDGKDLERLAWSVIFKMFVRMIRNKNVPHFDFRKKKQKSKTLM